MTKKILVVDDSRGWLNYHVSALEQTYGEKFNIETAISAREGYDQVYNNISEPYALIISDLQMEYDFEPQYAGEWFIEQVKKLKEYGNTPIIIISATYNIKTIAEIHQVNYLSKSIAARDLAAYTKAIDDLLKT